MIWAVQSHEGVTSTTGIERVSWRVKIQEMKRTHGGAKSARGRVR